MLDAGEDPRRLIALNVEEGLSIQSLPAALLAKVWQPLPDYPAERCARLYAGYARFTGATEEAMRALQRLTTITEEDITMATAKRNATPPVKRGNAVTNEKETLAASVRTGTKVKDLPTGGTSRKPAATKAPAAKKASLKKPAAKKPEVKKAPAAKAAPKAPGEGRKPGSGALIRELILKGKDVDAILAEVKKRFPDSKAGPSDVSWNRGKLRKEGHQV